MEKERDRQLQWGELVATIDFDVRLPDGNGLDDVVRELMATFGGGGGKGYTTADVKAAVARAGINRIGACAAVDDIIA